MICVVPLVGLASTSSQGFSLKKWVGAPPIFKGKSPGDEVDLACTMARAGLANRKLQRDPVKSLNFLCPSVDIYERRWGGKGNNFYSLPHFIACFLFYATQCCGILITPLAGSNKSRGLYLSMKQHDINPIQKSTALYNSHIFNDLNTTNTW